MQYAEEVRGGLIGEYLAGVRAHVEGMRRPPLAALWGRAVMVKALCVTCPTPRIRLLAELLAGARCPVCGEECVEVL